MLEPMTPEQAWAELQASPTTRTREYLDRLAFRALRTLAGMDVESDYRVVDPDTNGGKYETRRYERYVTEWQEVPK